MLIGACTVWPHRSKTVRIVNQQTEIVLLLQRNNIFKFSKVARHSIDTFGNHQNTAARFGRELCCSFKLRFKVFDIVVRVNETFAKVQTHTINDAGMSFGVVNDHIAAVDHRIDYRHHPLITVIQQIGGFPANKSGKLALKLFVIDRLPRHHSGSHGIGHTKFCGSLGIGLTHFGMVGQTQIIV